MAARQSKGQGKSGIIISMDKAGVTQQLRLGQVSRALASVGQTPILGLDGRARLIEVGSKGLQWPGR